MTVQFLIVGGGIGGLAAALALGQRGHSIELFEQAEVFSEVGAGVQLSPNVTRRLRSLGVGAAIDRVAARPASIVVRRAADGARIISAPQADRLERRYGAPYVCIHRADLHNTLLEAVRTLKNINLNTGVHVDTISARNSAVCAATSGVCAWEGDALIGADGVWGRVRSRMINNAQAPHYTGHTAWRALAPMDTLPSALRSTDVQVWLGPKLHAVAYPVRAGQALNLVVIAESPPLGDVRNWDQAANAAALHQAIGAHNAGIMPLIEAMPSWRTWSLNGRAPVAGPREMAQGRIALVGDAAHPMVPYLAQGAGMAIEDAVALAAAVDATHTGRSTLPEALQDYAQARWQRNAQVQAHAWRNGQIYHAQGVTRLGRDLSLRLLGERLLDMPWLYAG
ncbi:MAG: FAD-dependent monooxygenase [Burkholderiaceae bacterium]|jgi:salicylate hydroxylase|nr:FAD-dependent monooxygenase [Burkholderiaceae bacterium]